ncbi:MAG: hypothetical protein WCK39_08130 [Methanomassiliicoccales archaeon]
METNSVVQTVVINGVCLELTNDLFTTVVPAWPLMASLEIGAEKMGHRCAEKTIGLRLVAVNADRRTCILTKEIDGMMDPRPHTLAINAKLFLSDYATSTRVYLDIGRMSADFSLWEPRNGVNTKVKEETYPITDGMFIEHRADGLIRVNGHDFKSPVNGEHVPIICDRKQAISRQANKYAGVAQVGQEQALREWAVHYGLELTKMAAPEPIAMPAPEAPAPPAALPTEKAARPKTPGKRAKLKELNAACADSPKKARALTPAQKATVIGFGG